MTSLPFLAAPSQRKHTALLVAMRLTCMAVYSFALFVLLRDYAAIVWPFYGYSFSSPGLVGGLQVVFFIASASWLCPPEIRSPSTLILLIVYLFVVVPSIICLFYMDPRYSGQPTLTSFFIVIGYAGARFLSRSARPVEVVEVRKPHFLLIPGMMALSAILLAFLYWRFGGVMSFVALDSIYEQRERGAAQNFVEGYAQTYSQYVLSTGLLAVGLVYRKPFAVILGLFGSVSNYMITAEKAGLMYPAFIVVLYIVLSTRLRFLRGLAFISLSLAAIVLFSVWNYQRSQIAEFSAWYLGMRTILTPGALVVHYLNFFESIGNTFFSHVRGLNFFVPPPTAFANDVRFPEIGVIIGEDYFNFPKLNANASFLASDGIASLGLLGIPIVFALLGLLLRGLDAVSRGVGKAALLILLPIALTLTNGSLFTVLASFGGLFWILVLRFCFLTRAEPTLRGVPDR